MNNEMKFPYSCVELNEAEMSYTDGGSFGMALAFGAGTIGLGALGIYGDYKEKEINKQIEQDIYDETIRYLREHVDANQMLADHEAREAYVQSARYEELMHEYKRYRFMANCSVIGMCFCSLGVVVGLLDA